MIPVNWFSPDAEAYAVVAVAETWYDFCPGHPLGFWFERDALKDFADTRAELHYDEEAGILSCYGPPIWEAFEIPCRHEWDAKVSSPVVERGLLL